MARDVDPHQPLRVQNEPHRAVQVDRAHVWMETQGGGRARGRGGGGGVDFKHCALYERAQPSSKTGYFTGSNAAPRCGGPQAREEIAFSVQQQTAGAVPSGTRQTSPGVEPAGAEVTLLQSPQHHVHIIVAQLRPVSFGVSKCAEKMCVSFGGSVETHITYRDIIVAQLRPAPPGEGKRRALVLGNGPKSKHITCQMWERLEACLAATGGYARPWGCDADGQHVIHSGRGVSCGLGGARQCPPYSQKGGGRGRNDIHYGLVGVEKARPVLLVKLIGNRLQVVHCERLLL